MSRESEDRIPLEAVEKWISTQGYSFEMEVQQKIDSLGFYSILSDHYIDFETGKSREIDVTAFAISYHKHPFVLRIILCIECKYLRSKPWVIFSSKESNSGVYTLNQLMMTDSSMMLINKIQEGETTSNPLLNPVFIGHSIVHALRDKKEEDLAYVACMSAFKAAVSTIEAESKGMVKSKVFATIVIPIVILDGQLFDCHLGEDKKPVVSEVTSGVVEWKYQNPTHQSPLVYVVTRSGLDDFLRNVEALKNSIFKDRAKHEFSLNNEAMEIVRISREKNAENKTDLNKGTVA